MKSYNPYPAMDHKIYLEQLEKMERAHAIPALCEAIERFFIGWKDEHWDHWYHPEVHYKKKMTWTLFNQQQYQRAKAIKNGAVFIDQRKTVA